MRITVPIGPGRHRVIFSHLVDVGNDTQVVLYVGWCEYKDLFNLTKYYFNAKWKEVMASREKLYIEIIQELDIRLTEREIDGLTLMYALERRAWANDCPFIIPHGNGKSIRCMETGRIYESSKELCKEKDINQSNLSKHLNRMPGYKTVRGMTYERV